MADSSFFAGRVLTTPQVASTVNDTAFTSGATGPGNTVAYLGVSGGGKPNIAGSYSTPAQALAALVSGDLLTATQKAFSASTSITPPGAVLAMPIGTATPATLALLDSGGNPSINLTSTQYGLSANSTKVRIGAGSVSGLQITTALSGVPATIDNVGRNAFTVQYAGAAASASMAVNAGATSVSLYAPAGAVVRSIDLTQFTTMAQLVDQINATPGFTATIAGASLTANALQGLDACNTDVKTNAYVATSNLAATIAALNQSPFITAAPARNAGLPPAQIGFTFLAGGTTPGTSYADWANALVALPALDVQWGVPLSSDPAVWAMTDAHVQLMSSLNKERRALVGPALGTTLAQIEALPAALGSDRTSVCWPGYVDYNSAGGLVTLPSYQTAALIAAGFAGSAPGTAMTGKAFAVRGLEQTVRFVTDTDPLIQAGVLCMMQTTTGYVVVRSISTWLTNNNYNRVEVSCGAAVDYTVRSVRQACAFAKGGPVSPIALARVVAATEAALAACAVPAPNGPATIVGDANSPAFTNVQASAQGDVISVSFTCSPVIPDNFIEITASLVPYTGTVTG